MNFRKYLPGKLGKKDLSIPVVRLSGAIAASSGPLNRTLSLSGVGPLLEKAFEDKQAPAVALVINSPGGSPVQSRLMYQRIRELASFNWRSTKSLLIWLKHAAALS